MPLQFDPSDDLAGVADGLSPVTVTRPGSSAATEVAHALRCAITAREAERAEGQYTASDVAWHLPATELPAAPRLGDVIVDAEGQRWTVLSVQRTTMERRWRCVCRNLAVACGLDQYVDVLKASYTKDSSGAEHPTWRTWRTGLRARIQPVEVLVKDEHDRQVTAAAFRVFVAEEVSVDHTCRIRGPDGTVYQVTGCRKAGRIDALVEIDVMRVG
jgi:hypothetical protein